MPLIVLAACSVPSDGGGTERFAMALGVQGDGVFEVNGVEGSIPHQQSFDVGATVTLRAVPGDAARFVSWTGDTSSSQNPLTLTMNGPLAVTAVFATTVVQPVNDDFVDAMALEGESGTVSTINAGASKELDEPDHGGEAGGRSLWWTWTVAKDDPVIFDASRSGVDTFLAVYTGSTLAELARSRRTTTAAAAPPARHRSPQRLASLTTSPWTVREAPQAPFS